MFALLQDVRHGLRTWKRSRATAALAIVLIGVGIGVNAAIFSAVNAVLVRPLPYAGADGLVVLTERHPAKGLERQRLSPARYLEWQGAREVFADVAAYDTIEQNLTGLGQADRVRVARFTSNLLPLIGVSPLLGRAFTASDERAEAPPVALITEGLWQQRMGRASLEGRTLRLDDHSFTIVGVLPAGFALAPADVYVPLSMVRQSRVSRHLDAIGRLSGGMEIAAARERVSHLAALLERTYPATDAGWTTTVTPLREAVVGEIAPALRVMLGAAGLVLLITCANVASLLLVHAAGRRRELAVRLALGAARTRILRQLLTESVLITAFGAVFGLILALWLAQALRALPFARFAEIRVNGTGLAFTLALTLLAGLLTGFIPALTFARDVVARELRGSGRQRAGDELRRGGAAIVVLQVAMAVGLAVGAGLLVASLRNLVRVDVGFQPANVLTGRMTFPRTRYRAAADFRRFERDLLERVLALPGVASAGVINTLPLTGRQTPFNFRLEGRRADTHTAMLNADMRVASPGYFAVMGIPVVTGRGLEERDDAGAAPVLVVNRTMARQFWAGDSPVGRRLSLAGPDGPWATIVGVVGDVKHAGLTTSFRPEMYFPFAQETWPSLSLVVRARVSPQSLAEALRNAVAAIDPELPLYDLRLMDEVVADTLARPRFLGLLVSAFAGLALVLAFTGVFGVVSHAVAQRTPEIAIRLALGAQPREVISLVRSQGGQLVAGGVALGLAGAWLLTRVMTGVLFGVSATDARVFILTGGLVSIAGLLACQLPARRAGRVDPAALLREV
jgi:predicted permease